MMINPVLKHPAMLKLWHGVIYGFDRRARRFRSDFTMIVGSGLAASSFCKYNLFVGVIWLITMNQARSKHFY